MMNLPKPNHIINDYTDYYVSYNNVDTDPDLYGCDTTAIVLGNMEKFLILNGDHRGQLKGKPIEFAIQYFKDNIDLKNFRSESV